MCMAFKHLPLTDEQKRERDHKSLVSSLRSDIRSWSKARNEWIARAGGLETDQSRRCDQYVQEAREALDALTR